MANKKSIYYSKEVRDSARGQDCSIRLDGCSYNNEQTILAHVGSNRGMGYKCGDNMAIYACYNCHLKLDKHNKRDFAVDIIRALEETHQYLFENDLLGFNPKR